MAFVSLTGFPVSSFHSKSLSKSPLSVRYRTPLRFPLSFRPVISMCTSSNDSEEVSVPLTSLKDLKAPPTPKVPETEDPESSPVEEEEEDTRTEAQKEIDRLRAAEKFIEIDEGKFECAACGYVYDPNKGVVQAGIEPNVAFEDLPSTFVCPQCRSPKNRFVSMKKVIAGFADNQKYGFGSNSMTEGEKTALIFGGLVVAFLLLLSSYALN